MMFIDSNRAFLDAKKLWQGIEIVPTGSLPDLRKNVEKMKSKIPKLDIVAIHVGVNDIDNKAPKTVAEELFQSAINFLSSMKPGGKVIISEVTPRQFRKDKDVRQCNKHLAELLANNSNIILARHSNLRDDEWTFHKPNDDKHLKEDSIARFASNLKIAFRVEIGIIG